MNDIKFEECIFGGKYAIVTVKVENFSFPHTYFSKSKKLKKGDIISVKDEDCILYAMVEKLEFWDPSKASEFLENIIPYEEYIENPTQEILDRLKEESGDEVCSWEKIKEYYKIALDQDEDKSVAIDLYFYSPEKKVCIWCHDGLITAGDEKENEETYKVFNSFDELFSAEVLPGFVIKNNWNNLNWIEINGYCLSEFLDVYGLENYLETYTTEYLQINDITWIGVDKNGVLFACFAGGLIGNIPDFVQKMKVWNENLVKYLSMKRIPFTEGKVITDMKKDCPMYEDCLNFTARGLYCFDISDEEDGSYTKVAVPDKPLKLKDLQKSVRKDFKLFYSRKVDVDVCTENRIVVEDAKVIPESEHEGE